MTLLTETTTVGDVIFAGGHAKPVDSLAKSMQKDGTLTAGLAGRAVASRGAVEHAVAGAVGDVVSMDLLDLALGGWTRYEKLTEAARRTRDAPTSREVVELATHQIRSEHRPEIELFVDGASVTTIAVKLVVTFDIAGAVAVVRRARLMEILSGKCTVTVTLAIRDTVVARQRRQFDLPGTLALGEGVPLLRDQPADPHRRGRGATIDG